MVDNADIVAEDLPKYGHLLTQIDESVTQISGIIEKLKEQVSMGPLKNHNDGLDILKIKNECMSFYLSDLLNVAGCQLSGVSLEDSPLVNRLIEQRVVLERCRPLEEKLNYKIDKLIKMAGDKMDSNDPLKSKPDVDNLDLDSESEEDDEETTIRAKNKKYIAPKLKSVPYMLESDKKERELEHAKKRALGSSVINELRRDGDEPDVEETRLLYQTGKMSGKALAAEKHRKQFEDDNMIRTHIDKRDRHLERDAMKRNEMNNLTHFGDTSVLYGGDSEDSKKRKGGKGRGMSSKKRKR